jgi:predicted DCC family thiol-disulfide oxidoreductase YuxK
MGEDASGGRRPELLFYDGGCGLCHRAVRFVIRADPDGDAFVFAPLGGETFERLLPAPRPALPDSLIVRTHAGALLVRSAAVVHVLRRLGSPWTAVAAVVALVPRVLRDAGYDAVARLRRRLFARPAEACPRLPAPLRARLRP